MEGIGLDPRIGPKYLRPGIGFGGSCLPKELSNLMRLGRRKHLPVHLLQAASSDNGGRARRIAARIDAMVGGLLGCRVALLGLSFKPGTDDLRYSPAVGLAKTLLERGAHVVAHDPVVPVERTAHVSGLERATDVAEACRDADVVVLATAWPDYLALDWQALARVVSRPILFDGRNALNATSLRRAGWIVVRIGQVSRPQTRSMGRVGASKAHRPRRRYAVKSPVPGG